MSSPTPEKGESWMQGGCEIVLSIWGDEKGKGKKGCVELNADISQAAVPPLVLPLYPWIKLYWSNWGRPDSSCSGSSRGIRHPSHHPPPIQWMSVQLGSMPRWTSASRLFICRRIARHSVVGEGEGGWSFFLAYYWVRVISC